MSKCVQLGVANAAVSTLWGGWQCPKPQEQQGQKQAVPHLPNHIT